MPRIWQTARVFISSTFRDMHAERDHLVKKVLPRLRARLAPYRVYLEDVDLRWGVTENQAKSGRAIELCLEETDGCRPIFLCLLGSRYGWVPHDGDVDERLRQRFPWTAEYHDRSITELEIIYAALEAATRPARALFCFRDERVNESIPEPVRSSDYIETDPVAAQKLADLKDRIRRSGLPCLDGYLARWDDQAYDSVNKTWGRLVDLDELDRCVEEQLWQAIKAEHSLPDSPPADDPDPLALEADFHERFLESRLRIHVGREADDRFLMEFATGRHTVACLLGGPMGVGKSTALAKLVETCRRQRPGDFVLAHFVGASPQASRPRALLRRCCLELKRHFELPNEVPDALDALIPAFRGMLFSIPEDRRAVLIVDAVDQLEEEGPARQLSWLPEELPPHVKVVLSCRFEPSANGPPKPCVEELGRRLLPREIGPLSDDECRQIARALPSLAAKTLSEAQLDLLLANSATRNPLYLRVALEELRGFGSFDRLAERIGQLPDGTQPLVELFDQVLGRLEDDFDAALVRTSLPLMILARGGLAEQELETLCDDVTGSGELQGLLRHLRPHLRPRGDHLDFAHQAPVEAIQRRYLRSERARRGLHRKLADFFAALPRSARQVYELPWQLAQAAYWRRLYELLADPGFLEAAWDTDQYETKSRWAQLEREGGPAYQMVKAYQPVLDDPSSANQQHLWKIATLLQKCGHPREALRLRDHLADYYRQAEDKNYLQACLSNQAVIHQVCGELDHAMELHRQAEQICRELGNKDGLQACLGNRALILMARGELDRAMELLRQQEQICRELGNKDSLANALAGQALILKTRGELDRAMELHRQAEQICRELGNKDSLANALAGQAVILKTRGELDRAMELHRQEEQVCRELGNKDSLARSLGDQAVIHQARGEADRAMELLRQQEQICRELGNKDSLQRSLGNQACIHQARGELDLATELYRQQEQICRELGNKEGLAACLGNQACIHQARGELDLAMDLHRQAEQICRELGNKDGLQSCLGNQALILEARGELDRAMDLHRQAEQICRELGNKDGLARSLGNQACIHQARGELERAMELHRQEEQICRELGNKEGLQLCLCNQALILEACGELGPTMDRYRRAEQISLDLGNKDWQQRALAGQAAVHHARGELEQAMALYRQQEQICRELANNEGLARCLAAQAHLLASSGRQPRTALPLAEEALELAEEHGHPDLTRQIRDIHASIQAML